MQKRSKAIFLFICKNHLMTKYILHSHNNNLLHIVKWEIVYLSKGSCADLEILHEAFFKSSFVYQSLDFSFWAINQCSFSVCLVITIFLFNESMYITVASVITPTLFIEFLSLVDSFFAGRSCDLFSNVLTGNSDSN